MTSRVKKFLEEDICMLDVDDDLLNILKENNIDNIESLWKLQKKDLRTFGICSNDINDIIIKLQLHGLDLNKKIY